MTAETTIRIGTRVYLKNAIAGEPGCVVSIDSRNRAAVLWVDLDLTTHHRLDNLIVDESFRVERLGLDLDELAA